MATPRQIEANRRNAQKSTGPRTEAGKAVSRGNAVTHGLAGAGVVVPEVEADRVNRRVEEWSASIRPGCRVEAYLVIQAATESVRIERCQHEERVLLLKRAALAESGWEEDRRLAAEELGARLAKDPARTVARLRQTSQGCDWLLARWDGLARLLDSGQAWDDQARGLALDLLAVPAPLRSGRTEADADGSDSVARQAAVARREITALERLKADVMDWRDGVEREAAERGVGAGDAATERALARVRRYEAACQRRVQRALSLLLSGQVLDRAGGPDRRWVEAAEKAVAEGNAALATPPPAAKTPATAASAVPPAPAPEPRTVNLGVLSPAPIPASVEPGRSDEGEARDRGNRRWRKEQRRRERERQRGQSARLAVPA